jgi:hypothetical protein
MRIANYFRAINIGTRVTVTFKMTIDTTRLSTDTIRFTIDKTSDSTI